MSKSLIGGVRLVDLFEQIPPLFEACLPDASLRKKLDILRLLDKQLSKAVLKCVTTYRLNLNGESWDTNVDGASLLQSLNLKELNVSLRLTDSFSPAAQLESFVIEAGLSLASVTHLSLSLLITGHSTATAYALDVALGSLVSACPALRDFTSTGQLSDMFFESLGGACPELQALTIHNSLDDPTEQLPYLQKVVNLLPSLLPKVSRLEFHDYTEDLPDMSKNKKISYLGVPSYVFEMERQWLYMPPSLEKLFCCNIGVGPPGPPLGSQVLRSLHTVGFAGEQPTRVSALAQLLRRAALLRVLKVFGRMQTDSCWYISCPLALATAADLTLLHQRMDAGLCLQAVYSFVRPEEEVEGLFQSVVSALPCMKRVTACSISKIEAGELGLLLGVLPGLQKLRLHSLVGVQDVDLQCVAGCWNLNSLELQECDQITPMGLFALRQHLPRLDLVTHCLCALLKQPFLQQCVELLQGQGLAVRIGEGKYHR